MASFVKCDMCPSMIPLSESVVYFNHIKSEHQFSTKFYTTCKVAGCVKIFHLYPTFKRHWYREHARLPSTYIEPLPIVQPAVVIPANDAELPQVIEGFVQLHDGDDFGLIPQDALLPVVPQSSSSKLVSERVLRSGSLLALRQRHYLSYDALSHVQSATEDIIERKLATVQDKLKAIIPQDILESAQYRKVFEDATLADSLTRKQMELSWQKNFPAVLPVPVNVNTWDTAAYRWKVVTKQGVAPTLEDVPETGYVVPFLASLQQLLSITCVYESVMSSFRSMETSNTIKQSLSDIWDGSFVQNNPIFIKNKGQVLGFQIYYDEVEPSNPLGSKKSLHKFGVFYWTLMNLPPAWRSSLRSIQLLAIINSNILKKNGPSKLLQPFINDVKKLESGISLQVGGKETIWRGFVINFVGDMPASNYMGGFKESVGSAFRPCRVCYIKKSELELIHHESHCELRNKETHANQLKELLSDELTGQARTSISMEHGIVGPSSLSEIPQLDVTKCFVHDLMHLFYEGVLNLEIRLLLRQLIVDKIIDLDDINHKLALLKSNREFTIPPKIRKDEVMDGRKLSFSSSEMQSLSLSLPLVLGEYCSAETNPFYGNCILLLEIASSLLCYTFSANDLRLLQFNIEIHNSAFTVLYPKDSGSAITPKLHALIHLASQIRLFGPLRYSWCMRYESKNAPLKKVARRNSNFVNAPYTLASNLQKLVGLDIGLDSNSDFFGMNESKVVNMFKSKIAYEDTCWFKLFPSFKKLNSGSYVQHIRKCKISGRTCIVGSVFVDKLQTDETLPKFWRISDMLMSENSTTLIFEELATLYFSMDTFSFTVKPLKKYHARCKDELLFNIPLHSFLYKQQSLVVPCYYHLL